jgi:hypothetical protein
MAVGISATDSAIGRPIPRPFPQPGSVTYEIDAQMPSWPTEDDVLRYVSTPFPSGNVKDLASAVGLPVQALGSDPKLLSFNFSWKDADNLQWSYDASSRMASFWKETNYRVMDEKAQADPAKEPPKVDDNELVRIADDFLTRKGFGNIQRGAGKVENPYGAMPYGATDASIRCPMPLMEGTSNAGSGVSGGSAKAASETVSVTAPAIAPDGVTTDMMPRCWWPSYQVTVVYDGMRNGKRIADAGGYPWRAVTVTVDLTDKTVTNGSVWMDVATESSKYPMLTKDIVEKRLKSGGRNPIYPWDGSGDITVRIKTLDLVWMRYDTWADGKNEAYLIPSIAGSGTIEYPDKRTEEYRTILPLVADDAFEETKPIEPIPLPAVQVEPASEPSAPVKE